MQHDAMVGLEMLDVSHHFGDRLALDGLRLTVSPGEVVGLVGRNGAGKTTAMRAIVGVMRPERGSITWGGERVAADVRRRFGYMPEERGLYPQMGLRDQLVYLARLHGLGAVAARAAATTWMDRLSLTGREADRVVGLSHGNQQRAQLAAALVHAPVLAVLDEPFSGLDPEAIDKLSRSLRDLAASGTAVLFSSHQLELVAQLCDRIVIVEAGRAQAAGTLAELQARFPRHLRVRVSATDSWTAGLRGIELLSQDKEGVLLGIPPDVDLQPILRAAQAAGAVEHFAVEPLDLAALFRRLVAA